MFIQKYQTLRLLVKPTSDYCVVEHHKHNEGAIKEGEGYEELVEAVAHVPGEEHLPYIIYSRT